MKIFAAALILTLACNTHASAIGDPESFGNKVIYLGLADSSTVNLLWRCPAGRPANGERCVTLNAQPAATIFDEADVASIELAPDATDSLLCFSFTPMASRTFRNSTATTRQAELNLSLKVTISSSVLQDPSLMDPATGLPLSGSLQHGMAVDQQSFTMEPGDFRQDAPTHNRVCSYGFVHRAQLIDYYGLTPTQADAFFAAPITLRFGLRGTVTLVESASYRFVVRLYGDDQ